MKTFKDSYQLPLEEIQTSYLGGIIDMLTYNVKKMVSSKKKMQVTEKTEELNNCSCGSHINSYTIGYGSTPYLVHCHSCKKHTNLSEVKVTGSPLNIIDFWNSKISTMSIEDIELENNKLRNKKRNQRLKNQWEYYDFFWFEKKGISIIKGY